MDLARESERLEAALKLNRSFNPCFNGSCSRIGHRIFKKAELRNVSILVLMDLAREYSPPSLGVPSGRRFNPCFNGSCSRMNNRKTFREAYYRFNPCFNGSCSRILSRIVKNNSLNVVSILVLMDLARE